MDDDALLRYSRHILLNEIGLEGQERISQARVLIVGAGGLGAAASMYLASAGVGTLLLADGDSVDLTNLQRQIVHREAAIGVNKAQSALATLRSINSTVKLEAISHRLDQHALTRLAATVDIVLDCSDNFATRHAINRACVRHRKPLVSGAAIRFDGQLTSFDARRDGAPCYQCLFPEHSPVDEERCAVMGVFAPLVGIMGAAQAAEALRIIAVIGAPLFGRLSMLDARSMEWREVKYHRDLACTVCGTNAQLRSMKMNRSGLTSIGTATLAVWCFAATLSSDAPAQVVYKYTDANGKVTYSDKPPKPGEKATLIKADKDSNVITLPQPKGTAAQREQGRQAAALRRDKEQSELSSKLRAAETRFDEATKALEDGRAPRPDEQRIVVREGGNSVIRTADYADRVAKLEEAVKTARDALDRAREAQKRGSPD